MDLAGYLPKPGYPLELGYLPEPGNPPQLHYQVPEPGYLPEPGYPPQSHYQVPEPGYLPESGYPAQPHYHPQPGYLPMPGYPLLPGYPSMPGYPPQPYTAQPPYHDPPPMTTQPVYAVQLVQPLNIINVEAHTTTAAVLPVNLRPTDYMCLSIYTCLFCCLPCGLAAMVCSCKVNSSYEAGNYERAVKNFINARRFNVLAIICGMVLYVMAIIF